MANDLRIQEVRLAGFRNYRSLALGNIGGLTIFVGPNATGKSLTSSREFNFVRPWVVSVRPAAVPHYVGRAIRSPRSAIRIRLARLKRCDGD